MNHETGAVDKRLRQWKTPYGRGHQSASTEAARSKRERESPARLWERESPARQWERENPARQWERESPARQWERESPAQ